MYCSNTIHARTRAHTEYIIIFPQKEYNKEGGTGGIGDVGGGGRQVRRQNLKSLPVVLFAEVSF